MTGDGPPQEPIPCGSCGQPVWPGDNFCEACQAPLPTEPVSAQPVPAQPVPAQPVPAQPVPAREGAACRHCGPGRIGPDGYCDSCGRKAPAERDHIEAGLGLLAGVTDRGLRHSRNEDAMALAAAPEAAIAVVSDGVSDSDRPDEASLTAVRTALRVLLGAVRAGQDVAGASIRAAAAAQTAVCRLSIPRPGETQPQETQPARARPGQAQGTRPSDAPSATFASAVVAAGTVTVCWLGDSRVYWLDAGQPAAAQQLTRDDSLAAEMVSQGLLAEAEAMTSAQAHVVTGWLGADAGRATAHVASFTPPGAGAVLVCTDGLWNYQPEPEKLAVRALPGGLHDPLGAARDLVDFALGAGGRDNVTVAVIPFPLAGAAGPVRTYPGDLVAGSDVTDLTVDSTAQTDQGDGR